MKTLRFLIMAWLFLAGLIMTGLVGPNRMAVREEFGLSETGFGAGVAVTQASAALAVLVIAHWLARWKPVTILMAGLSVVILGFLIVSLSHHLAALIVGWTLVTAGLTMGMITNNISMDLWPQNPRRGVVLLHGFNAGGKVVGPLIAAVFLGVGYRLSFVAVGAITLAVLVVCLLLRRHGDVAVTRSIVDPGSGLRVLRRPAFWLFMLWIGMIAGGEAAFATLLPTYFKEGLGYSAQVGTLALTVHLLGLTAGRFASAWLGHRAGNGTVIALCLATGVFVFPVMFFGNQPAILVSLFVFGLMFSSTWPSFYAAAAEWLPDCRHMMPYGSALGNYVVMGLCILGSSMIADHNLWLAMFFGPAVLWLFGAMYLIRWLVVRTPTVAGICDRAAALGATDAHERHMR